MIYRIRTMLFAFTVLILVASQGTGQTPPKIAAPTGFEGIWEGPLKVGPVELRLAFTVTKSSDGKLAAKMDSIDQGAKGIPCGEVTLTEGTATIAVPAIKGTFVGKLADDGQSAKGEWEQVGQKYPLLLKRVEKASTLNRPQLPKPPFPYRSEDVTFENASAKNTLAGTLTLPKGDGPFPVAIFVSGSGPQERDSTLFGHKPFLVWADHLTRHGIAVLRYDDRGVGKSTGKQEGATSADFATDTAAAVTYLKTRKEIDVKQIGIVGHSEGGLIAPMVAAELPNDVGFLVLLAGPGLPGHQISLGQSEAILKSMKVSELKARVELKLLKNLLEVVKVPGTVEVKKESLLKVAKQTIADMTDEEKKTLFPFGNVESETDKAIKKLLPKFADPWSLFFLQYEPAPTLEKVKCPVLAVNGEYDLQVLPKENLAGIEKALKAGGNTRLTVKEFPGLNHLFQHSKTGAINEYSQIEETISPEVLNFVTDWIARQK